MFKKYYYLTKPGIIYGNVVNTAAGFFLASQGIFDFKLLALTLIGISLVVASACVFNNIIDVDMDARMDRTKNRAMVKSSISKTNAIIFGSTLLILGLLTLSLFTSHLSLIAGLSGFVIYIFLYTPLKRKTLWATEIGSISGAMPPLAGYLAVSNRLDAGAIILFFIFALWQMPHFYAIAIYRLSEYKNADIPILPAIKGIFRTKINILLYIIAYALTLPLLYIYWYTNTLFLVSMSALSLYWLKLAIDGFRTTDHNLWAKKVFKFSLIIVLAFCVIIPIDALV